MVGGCREDAEFFSLKSILRPLHVLYVLALIQSTESAEKGTEPRRAGLSAVGSCPLRVLLSRSRAEAE